MVQAVHVLTRVEPNGDTIDVEHCVACHRLPVRLMQWHELQHGPERIRVDAWLTHVLFDSQTDFIFSIVYANRGQ